MPHLCVCVRSIIYVHRLGVSFMFVTYVCGLGMSLMHVGYKVCYLCAYVKACCLCLGFRYGIYMSLICVLGALFMCVD